MRIEGYLDSDEHMLWQGAPPGGLMLRAQDVFMIPFSLLWGGFAIFWEFTAYISGAPEFFLLFGGVFVLVGIYIVVGRFVVDAWVRSGTTYALTNRRALIVSGLFSKTLESFPIERESQISVSAGTNNRRGNIKFGGSAGLFQMQSRPQMMFGTGAIHPFVFERIENPQRVYQQIRDVQNSHR